MSAIKRFASIMLAAIIILCTSIVAFASDVYTCPLCSRKYNSIAEYNLCIDIHNDSVNDAAYTNYHKCGTCGKLFTNLDSYNACVDSHFNNVNYHYDKYVGLTVPELCSVLVEIFNKSGATETAQAFIDKTYDLVAASADKEFFSNEISKLELGLDDLELDNAIRLEAEYIIDELKSSLENDNEKEIAGVETTEAVFPADTGSASTGVAVFATVSVAAVAVFIIIKKKN